MSVEGDGICGRDRDLPNESRYLSILGCFEGEREQLRDLVVPSGYNNRNIRG